MLQLLAISDRQDLYSMSYVRAIIAASGFNYSKSELDRNSDDLSIELASTGDIFPNYSRLIVQVKCTYSQPISEDGMIHYPLPIKNYDDLRGGVDPKILVVVRIPRPDEIPVVPWVECANQHTIFRYRAYWISLWNQPPTQNQGSVTVLIPITNSFDTQAVQFLMNQMVIQGIKAL